MQKLPRLLSAHALAAAAFVPAAALFSFAAAPTNGLVAAYTFNTSSPNADSTGKSPSANSKNGVTRTTNRFGASNSAWNYDGVGAYAEIADHNNFSVNTTGYLTVCAWVKPVGSSLNAQGELLFADTQGSGYVYYIGKGTTIGTGGNQEWAFRIYSADNTEDRHNRMGVYHWKYSGGLGPGSYFQVIRGFSWVSAGVEIGAREQPLVGLIFASGSGGQTAVKEKNQPDRGLKRRMEPARSAHGATLEQNQCRGSGGGRALWSLAGHSIAVAGAARGPRSGGAASADRRGPCAGGLGQVPAMPAGLRSL